MKESIERQKDVTLEEMVIPTAEEANEQPSKSYKQQQLCELSRALAVLAKREEFLRLVNNEIELYSSMVEKEGTDSEEVAKKAYRAARTNTDHAAEMEIGHKFSSSLIEKVLQ